MTQVQTGGCACASVRYTVTGPLRPVVACHCRECRRASGHFWAATRAYRADLRIDRDEGLRWYDSSPGVRRGFCALCGSSLFFDRAEADGVSIGAGSLDEPTGLELVQHIFAGEQGDYYGIGDDLPRYPAAGPMPPVDAGEDPS